MPDDPPKTARSEGYRHDPTAFPSLPQAGPRYGWQLPSKPPNLCGVAVDAAVAVLQSQQPHASPLREPPVQEARTRAQTASAEALLADLLRELKPRGCVQRAVQLSKAERRELNTEQKRQRRALDKQWQDAAPSVMAELGRYDLPLVQLLMGEYALNPVWGLCGRAV